MLWGGGKGGRCGVLLTCGLLDRYKPCSELMAKRSWSSWVHVLSSLEEKSLNYDEIPSAGLHL